MYHENFSLRLSRLRSAKGVSARDMSLSIGQNAGYINTIESGKALPSMSAFFFICEYLNVSPGEFFDEENKMPEKLHIIVDDLKKLNPSQLESIAGIVKELANK